MGKISTFKETYTHEDADGNITTSTTEKTSSIEHNNEPDYIKLYTKMWCEFNQIPDVYRNLFIELVSRMSYCNASDLENSQLVNTGKPWSDAIMKTLGWKSAMYFRGLKALSECGAIKKVARSVYQINPSYAGKGEWKYNPRLNRGGVEDLIATFSFKNGQVQTDIIWADDGTDSQINEIYRQGIGARPEQNTVMKTTSIKPDNVPEFPDIEGQMTLDDVKKAVGE